MILHGIFESRFKSEEALVNGYAILAVERDHLARASPPRMTSNALKEKR